MRILSFTLLFISFGCIYSTAKKTIRNKHDALTYLEQYGYNPCSNSSKEVRCSIDYSSMLRNFQKRHSLNQTGVLDASTKKQMNRPRCGNSDVQAFRESSLKWTRSSLTWSLHNHPRQLSRSQASAIVRDAFNAWLAYIPLQITEACSTCSADFVLSFGSYNHNCNGGSFDGQGGTLAHAFFPENGRIHFDAHEPWTTKFQSSGINFYLVAVHEIGHALGLDHSNDRTSIMYPSYIPFPSGSMLPNRDRESIQALYGRANGGNGDCNGNRCGCYNGYCWAYADAEHTNRGDWWCYTQKAGVSGKQGIWQTCSADSDCSWDRTCGSCNQYKGFEEEKKVVC